MLVKCNGNCRDQDCPHYGKHVSCPGYCVSHFCYDANERVTCEPVEIVIPPKTITDDVSGVEVPNSDYNWFMKGQESGIEIGYQKRAN